MADPPRRRDTPTPTGCPHCHGRSRIGCRLCGGAGFVSREVAAQYQAERSQRLTGQFSEFESIAQQLVLLLDARDTDHAKKLAAEGMRLLEEFAERKGLESGDMKRHETVIKLLDYQRNVLVYLAGNR